MTEKYKGINFKPPASVANAAKKGLEYRQKASPSNRGGLTPSEAGKQGIGSGVQRATNLKNRSNLSPKVVRQMAAFFSRHEKNKAVAAEHKSEPWNDKGHVAWLLWGGDPGKTWANKVVKQMEAADSAGKAKAASDHDEELEDACWEGYEAQGMKEKDGKMVPNCVPVKKAGEDGNYMTVQYLQAMKDHASMLLKKVTADTPLPDWVIAKVNKANTYLLDAFEGLMHGSGKGASHRVEKLAARWLRKTAEANPRVGDTIEVTKAFKASTTIQKRLTKGTHLKVLARGKGHNRNRMLVRDEKKGLTYDISEDWDLENVKVVGGGQRWADLHMTKKQMDELHAKGKVEVDGETITYKEGALLVKDTPWTVYLFSDTGKVLFENTFMARSERDAERRGLALVKPHIHRFDNAEDWVVEPAQQ
jgi:hypothetical protein